MKKTLCKTIDEYKAHVKKILDAINNEVDIWEGHDYERLKPFFKWQYKGDYGPRDQEVLDSMAYYLSITDSPEHKELVEFRDSLSGAGRYITTIEESYGIVPDHDCWDFDDDGNPIDEEGNVMTDEIKWESWVDELTFPLVIVESINSDWDRSCGDYFIFIVDFVELKDFA